MAIRVDIVEHLSELLSRGDSRNLKAIMNEETFDLILQEKAFSLIPIASHYLNEETEKNSPAVFRCIEKLLMKCAEKGNPKECLMEFLALTETLEELKFQILLKPIQTVLLRIPEKKAPLVQSVGSVVYSFLNSLQVQQYTHLDSHSKLLLDCDKNVQRIQDTYNLIISFYEPIVCVTLREFTGDKRTRNLRLALLQALFHLLGHPLVALDLEENEKGNSAFRSISTKIVKLILRLQKDPLQFLKLVEDKELITVAEEKSIIKELSSSDIKFSDLSMSVFFYLILNKTLCPTIPCVYSNLFIFQNYLSLSLTLLCCKSSLVLRKGLVMIKAILESIEVHSLPFLCLVSTNHKELIDIMSYIAVYGEVEENRKLAVECIKQHIFSFEPKGQFYILLNCGISSYHPNIVGFLTSLLITVVKDTFNSAKLKEYFTGKKLFDLLNTYCTLKNGIETDLIENKNQILTALNLIIFLTKRDRKNETGFWNFISFLSNNFLSHIREAIDLSRAHYKLQLNTLNEPLKNEDQSELFVTVGGQRVGEMSIEEEKHVIKLGLTVFDLIEHLLSQANECVQGQPLP